MHRLVYFLFFIFLVNLAYTQNDFIIGQDLSYVNQMEDCGAEFREDGEIKDVYQIFADNGSNLVRVRLWHNPSWQESIVQPDGVKAQYNNFEDVKETIFRAKMAGMKVMLGFHFSDFWADPGRQILPKAWDAISNNETVLKDSIYNYVTKVLTNLDSEDIMPEYVKIGNENNSGIMTHKGMNSNHEGITVLSWDWSRHARLYNAAIKAVRDVSETSTIKPKIALHVADHNKAIWFYNNIISKGVTDFDIMGFTYYYSYHGDSPAKVGTVIKNLLSGHQGYQAMVVETGYLWDTQNIDQLGNIITKSSPSYQPVSPETQKKFMVDLSNAVKDAGGSGVIFWESAWVSTPCSTPWGKGSSQEHVAFFDHRNNLNYMKNGGGGWPNEFWNGSTPTESNVTFKVDMTDEDISRGVYIVGTMTDWEFIEMTSLNGGSSIFEVTLNLIPGDKHAFYYITNNVWDNYEEYRETVPDECATSDEILNDANWSTDRAFIVPQTDTTITNKWSSCEQIITSIKTPSISKPLYKIYPNPVDNSQTLTIQLTNEVKSNSINILNTSGKKVDYCWWEKSSNKTYVINGLNSGLYFIEITLNNQKFVEKILVL